MLREDRKKDQLREIKFMTGYTKYAEGSVLVEFGDTKVLCNATLENKVPPFLKGSGTGWITAEYSMLPRATESRTIRESVRGKMTGRTHEIQRLIGRSLRSVVDTKILGERTLYVDCDVIQADGGTRTASISGGFVAMCLAFQKVEKNLKWCSFPVKDYLGAISVGKVEEDLYLDLCYVEDCQAEVDMNVVMTGKGEFVEVQGTAEGQPFSPAEMNGMIELAQKGIRQIVTEQQKILTLEFGE